jgi:leucyl-tRNA synthetase
MALHDLGHLDFEEPFSKFRAHGLIVRGGAKMSKSRGNVIVPDPIIEEYGADAFRLYLMFLGPFEEGGDYRDEGIHGPFGFLNRLWDAVLTAVDRDHEGPRPDPEVERKLHQTIQQVTGQVPELQYNTAIAALMEYLNQVRAGGRTPCRAEVEPLIPMVAPFAPHIAEELWSRLGHVDSVFEGGNWPEFDPEKARHVSVTMAVQVSGKLRGTILGPVGMSQERAEALAREEENVARHLEGKEIRKVVFVPDRLLNFVVG